MEKISVSGGGRVFEAALADSFFSKFWGLSMKTSGKMLFVFKLQSKPTIDMMLVQKPLHLYFLDEKKNIVDVKFAEPWTLNPWTWRLYRPEKDAKFLLESFEDLGLEEGDELEFDL